MICVECGLPVKDVYRDFNQGNIKLTQCGHCSKFADKYVEWELMLIILDLFLHKAAVYRHILFNQSKVRPSSILSVMLKLVPAYLFFGSCLYWYRLKMYYSDYESLKFLTSIPMKPYDRHYLLLGITCLELVVFIVTVLFSVGVWRHLFSKKSTLTNANIAKTILLSRFGMLLVILMMIWDYDINLGRVINVFVLTSNISALKVLLETSLVNATLVVAMGFMAQLLVRAAVHTYDPSFVFFMF